jgi:hypothetical protein
MFRNIGVKHDASGQKMPHPRTENDHNSISVLKTSTVDASSCGVYCLIDVNDCFHISAMFAK